MTDTETRHLATASKRCLTFLSRWLEAHPEVFKAALVEDVVGRLSVAIWTNQSETSLSVSLSHELEKQEVAGPFWGGSVLVIPEAPGSVEVEVGEELMRTARPIPGTAQRLWLAERYRSRGAWLSTLTNPPWEWSEDQPTNPPIVVFYSFKGGVGRSTALASTAIQLACSGKKVFVIDADLEAPGIAQAFLPEGADMPEFGLVDYLLDSATISTPDVDEYVFACRAPALAGDGEILVMSAGKLDESYLGRLARLSFDPTPRPALDGLSKLLLRVRDLYRPDWILVDARTGLADVAGATLAGVGHCAVLCATGSGQTWSGLSLVVDMLGRHRLQMRRGQTDCIVLHTMIPREPNQQAALEATFKDACNDCFEERYYADEEAARDAGLSDDAWIFTEAEQDGEAPHRPISVLYDPGLAAYFHLEGVAQRLRAEPGLAELVRRLTGRFERRASVNGVCNP